MDLRKQFQAELFTKVSKGFDQSGPQFFSYFGKVLADIAGINCGFTVLDVGCGRGASLIPAAKLVGNTGKVVGIDIAEGMITELEKDVEKLNLKNIELITGDIEQFEFSDRFDVILCGFSIAAFPDPDRVFNKFRQILKPDGSVAVSNWHKDAHKGWEWMSKAIGDNITSVDTLLKTTGEEYEFDTSETMHIFLKKMGLKNIEVSVIESLFHFRNEEEWWENSLYNGMRGTLDRMDDKSLRKFRKTAFVKLSEMKTEKGIPYPAKVISGVGQNS